jgi:hypothetical protein
MIRKSFVNANSNGLLVRRRIWDWRKDKLTKLPCTVSFVQHSIELNLRRPVTFKAEFAIGIQATKTELWMKASEQKRESRTHRFDGDIGVTMTASASECPVPPETRLRALIIFLI